MAIFNDVESGRLELDTARTFAPPRPVPTDLCWRLRTNVLVLWGSFFFALGIIFFIFIAAHTALRSRWRLSHDHGEAPGWLSASRKTNYTENDAPIYRYDYSFLLPNESKQSGSSYADDALHKTITAATLANPSRAQDFTIEFYPSDPGISRIKGTNVSLCSPVLLWVGTAPFFGLLLTLGGFAYARGKIRLLRDGVLAEATVRAAHQVKVNDDDGWLRIGTGAFSLSVKNPFDKLDPFIANRLVAKEGGPSWRVALRKGLRNFTVAAVSLVGALASSLWVYLNSSRFWTGPDAGGAALKNVGRWWHSFGWFVALLSALICVAVMAVTLVIEWRRNRSGQPIPDRKEPAKPGSIEAFREVQVRQQELAHRLSPMLLGLFFGIAAGIIAFSATSFLMAVRSIHRKEWHVEWHVEWPAVVVAGLAVVTTFVLVFRWFKRRPPPDIDRLETAGQTEVECTYEFRLPDGRMAQGKDRLPLPSGPDDIRARRVIYDPTRPDDAERLFGFFPPVRPSQSGQWEWAEDEPWRLRLFLVIIAYTVGPVLGCLLAWFTK